MMFWIMFPITFLLTLKMIFWIATIITCLDKRKSQTTLVNWYYDRNNREQVSAVTKADELLMTYLSPIQRWTYRRFGYFNEWRWFRRYRFFGYFYTGGVNEYWLGFIPITGWCITWAGFRFHSEQPPTPDLTLARLMYLRANKTFHNNEDVAISQPPIPAG